MSPLGRRRHTHATEPELGEKGPRPLGDAAPQVRGLQHYGLARDLIADGRIVLPRMITHKFPVTAIREAFELAHDRRDGVIKIGLQFDA